MIRFLKNLFFLQFPAWVVTLVQATFPGRTVTRKWQKQDAHREHPIAPKA